MGCQFFVVIEFCILLKLYKTLDLLEIIIRYRQLNFKQT